MSSCPAPASQTDTDCSTPENDTVEKIVRNDAVRYVKKGYGLFVAISIMVSFFYLGPIILKAIWPHFLALGDIQYVMFSTHFLFPALMFGLANLVMWVIYVGEFPFFERYRISPEKQWPWQRDPVAWRVTFWKTLKLVLFNALLVNGVMSAIGQWVTGQKAQYSLDTFPDHITIIAQITFMMVVEDFFFYFGHRLLHTPFLYKHIHKIHHEYYNAISLCAEYAHPLEFAFCNVLPSSAGYIILGEKSHLSVFVLWCAIRLFETIDGHSGYEFSWSPYRLLPLSGSSEYHNYHHSHNIGTYGSFFTYLDTLFKTNKDYFAYKARKERMEKAREAAKLNAKLDTQKVSEKLIGLAKSQ